MENIDYGRVFEEIADLLEIQGANPFRIRAYRNAARTIETLSQPLESLLKNEEARLEDLPGIGDYEARIHWARKARSEVGEQRSSSGQGDRS